MFEMSNGLDESEKPPYFFRPRPDGQLKSMPVRFRWEATRRHPTYGLMWESARDFFTAAKSGNTEDWEKRPLAATTLNLIGVYGAAPDPRLELDELDEQVLSGSWLSSSLTRVTLKSLIGRLLVALSPADFSRIMRDLSEAMESGDGEERQRLAGLLALQKLDESLDRTVPELLVSINPEIANGLIQREIGTLLDEWRIHHKIEVGRDRSDKFPSYFEVWDSREGWEKGVYFSEKERTLREVAETLEISEANANSRYRRAFELITGYPYSPVMWVRFMGIVKLSQSSVEALGRIARRRPLRSRTPRDVPESVVSPSEGTQGIISGLSLEVSKENEELRDLMIDISQKLESGMSNEEIRANLGIAGELNEVLDLLRSRFG